MDDFFEHVDYNEATNENPILLNNLIELLSEMGFEDREKNQRLLIENQNDLEKVVELLASDANEDVN